MKRVVGLVEDGKNPAETVRILEEAGFAAESIAVLRNLDALWHEIGCIPARVLATGFGIGAFAGIAIYALFGVLVAAGEAAMGAEPRIAVEAMIVFFVLGIGIGGTLGALIAMGAVEQESRAYVRGIRRGGALVAVCTADEHAPRAMAVLDQAGAENVKICTQKATKRPRLPATPMATDRLSSGLRWSARMLGLALIGIVLAFFIGEGLIGGDMPNPFAMSLAENFLLLALLMTLFGLLIAWRWEGIGALIIIGSVLLFDGVNAIASGSWRLSPLNPLFLLVAILFLWDWRRSLSVSRERPPVGHV